MSVSEYVTRREEVLSSEDLGGFVFERVKEYVEVRVKPCPFCGGPAKSEELDDAEGNGKVRIYCQSCGISSAEVDTYDEAADLWNHRRKDIAKTGRKGSGLCPFCGGKASLLSGDTEETEELYMVMCDECHAHTEYYAKAGDSVQRWNRRV